MHRRHEDSDPTQTSAAGPGPEPSVASEETLISSDARLTIRNTRVRGLNLVPDRPMETAAGTMTITPLVLIDVTTEEGITGRSYVRCYTPVALGPLVQLVGNLATLVERTSAAPLTVEATLRRHLRLTGTPGMAGMAMAGLDMALWDAQAKACGVPLVTLLGGEPRPIPAYTSLRTMRPAAAAEEAEKAASAGFTAVKVKLGRADLAADLETIRAVRSAVGDAIKIMVDYNQCLSVPEAIDRIRVLDDEGLTWIEEPTDSEDITGNARIRQWARTAIQVGENWSSPREVAANIAAGTSDYVTLDVMRFCGINGWLRAAAVAGAAGLLVSSHTFGEVSAHLLAVTPTAHWLEYLDHAGPILTTPMEIRQGQAVVPTRPGNGLDWDEDVIAPMVVHRT
jgi:mandelate racemase